MADIQLSVVGGCYDHKVVPFDAQQTINMYPELGGKGSKSPSILLRFPGFLKWLELSNGTGAIRGNGMYTTSNDRLFVVRGSALVELDSFGIETSRGTLNTSFGNVAMTDNGQQLGIADGSYIYQYVLATDTLSVVTDVDAPSSTPVLTYVDSYIFGFDPNAATLGEFIHCNNLDISDWLASDKYNAESNPDKLVSLIANNGNLWLFGSKSYEIWYNAATTTRTWRKLPDSAKEIGCGATNSVAKMGGRIFWLGASKEGRAIVYMSEGYAAREISNKPLESWLNEQSFIEDAQGFTMQFDGHWIYVLNFQTGNRTYCFDLSSGEWFRIAYLNDGTQERHRMIAHAFFNNKNYIGDRANGLVYDLNKSTYTDNESPQLCERYFSHFELNKEKIFWKRIEFGIQAGVGLSGQENPYLQLRWSSDGGRTFSMFRKVYLGKIGEYFTRVMTRRLGSSRNRTYHIRYSFATPFSIEDKAPARIRRGTS